MEQALEKIQNTPFELALTQYGIYEWAGSEDNPRILKFFSGIPDVTSDILKDSTAWCSAFVHWCMVNTKRPSTRSLMARSWLSIGEETQAPILGDLVIFWRGKIESPWGHVGFFVNQTVDGRVWCLGGNQKNQVSIKSYAPSRVLGFRKMPAAVSSL